MARGHDWTSTCSQMNWCAGNKRDQRGSNVNPLQRLVNLDQLDVNFWKINNVFWASNKQTIYWNWFFDFLRLCLRNPILEVWYDGDIMIHHTIIRAAFVCLFVCLCVSYLLRGPLTDLCQTWWVYVGGPPICPWGVLFQKGQRLDGSTGHFHFPLYYICTSLMP